MSDAPTRLIRENDYLLIWDDASDDKDIVAIIPKTGDEDYDSAVVYPRARLFASAPELLDALRELELRTRQFIAGELVAFPASLLPAVRAIIANATGE